MPILRAENLQKTYKGRKVVNGVSVEIKPGEIVGLLGPNGAGKTTSFYMMVGLVKPDGGRVLMDDKEITRLPMYKRAQEGIGYLAQEPSAFRGLTVAQNILLVLEMQPGLSKNDRYARLDELLAEFNLEDFRNTNSKTLSGGERRRVEIARVLATRPAFILLDEPFAAIDPMVKEQLKKVIGQLKAKDIGVLITDHDVLSTLAITDRAYILSDGEVKTAGTSDELSEDPIARKFYLGEDSDLSELLRAAAMRRRGLK